MNSNRKLKIFSFFSGCGILDLGFENAGYDIELVNEFYKPFIEAYQYSREKMGIRKPSFVWAPDSDVQKDIAGIAA